jgi:hypothetical protein
MIPSHSTHRKEDSIYVFPETKLRGRKVGGPIVGIISHRHMNVGIANDARSFISENICFKFAVQCLCSVCRKNL